MAWHLHIFPLLNHETQPEDPAMSIDTKDKLHHLLEEFDTAMLVTRSPAGEPRARPMAVAQVDPDGTLWFMTQHESGKVEEIDQDDRVAVVMQSAMKFVSLSGEATPVDDRQKVEELWKEAWKTWFPGGKDDPNLCLLHVRGDQGEYWDNSGAKGVKYLIEAGKAYLSGTRPDVDGDPKIHAKVEM